MSMADDLESIKTALKVRLGNVSPDRIVFVGVGNRLRGDDGIGPALIDLLEGKVPHALDVDSVPENYTGAIKRLKPSAIIFLDALDFGSGPGAVRIVEAQDVLNYGASTHNLSLDVAMEYLKHETGADVFLVGVQPAQITDSEKLSPIVDSALKRISSALADALSHR